MPLYPTWSEIALRLGLALVASFLIGLDRDEHGKSAGLRTTILVCMAATLAMLQANILLPTSGKTNTSFTVLDLERLPLGILSGIGFIGAGAILRKGRRVTGLTTAATLWIVTVLGLLFGGGQLVLGSAASAITIVVLWALKKMEFRLHAQHSAFLRIDCAPGSNADEAILRARIEAAIDSVASWRVVLTANDQLQSICCELRLVSRHDPPGTPLFVHQLAALPEVQRVSFRF